MLKDLCAFSQPLRRWMTKNKRFHYYIKLFCCSQTEIRFLFHISLCIFLIESFFALRSDIKMKSLKCFFILTVTAFLFVIRRLILIWTKLLVYDILISPNNDICVINCVWFESWDFCNFVDSIAGLLGGFFEWEFFAFKLQFLI